ncbi:MAG: hypothetical protein SGARI_001561 [Bacillariaceae sp.]
MGIVCVGVYLLKSDIYFATKRFLTCQCCNDETDSAEPSQILHAEPSQILHARRRTGFGVRWSWGRRSSQSQASGMTVAEICNLDDEVEVLTTYNNDDTDDDAAADQPQLLGENLSRMTKLELQVMFDELDPTFEWYDAIFEAVLQADVELPLLSDDGDGSDNNLIDDLPFEEV